MRAHVLTQVHTWTGLMNIDADKCMNAFEFLGISLSYLHSVVGVFVVKHKGFLD